MDNRKPLPDGFSTPIASPDTPEQRERWQATNRDWWERQPMRYDFTHAFTEPEFSLNFFDEIDRRFFGDAKKYMPWKNIPFDPLIDFDALKSKDVLEIGVGNGSHAALLAKHAKSFTGIDLTDYAAKSTSLRLRRQTLSGRILKMDAEQMSFPDSSFDFVWSWGVIHHSADTGRILSEIARVLRPAGKAITMVYQRNFWNYYIVGGLIQGLVRGKLFSTKSLHETIQQTTDGAIARYYSVPEWRDLASRYMAVDDIKIYGSKADLFPMPAGTVKNIAMSITPSLFTRFITNQCGAGTFLVSKMSKRG